MADVMAIVSKRTWKKFANNTGVGEALKWDDYDRNPAIDGVVNSGDRMFLVTVRDVSDSHAVWLVAIYENVSKKRRSWQAARPNEIPIADITSTLDHLAFVSGKGIKVAANLRGNSLQQPRVLTAEDVKLLLEAANKAIIPSGGGLPEADRRIYKRLAQVVARTAALRSSVLQKFGDGCAVCGLKLKDRDGAIECEVAHIKPVWNDGDDVIANAIPLCRTHHWAFDRYLWAIDPITLQIVVHEDVQSQMPNLHGREFAKVIQDTIGRRHVESRWELFTRKSIQT